MFICFSRRPEYFPLNFQRVCVSLVRLAIVNSISCYSTRQARWKTAVNLCGSLKRTRNRGQLQTTSVGLSAASKRTPCVRYPASNVIHHVTSLQLRRPEGQHSLENQRKVDPRLHLRCVGRTVPDVDRGSRRQLPANCLTAAGLLTRSTASGAAIRAYCLSASPPSSPSPSLRLRIIFACF